MSNKCPVTEANCHDDFCNAGVCLIEWKVGKKKEPDSSEKLWEDLIKKMHAQPTQFLPGPQNHHVHGHIDFSPLLEVLLSINQKLNKTMATIEEVQQAVADLQATVDTTQAAIAAAIKALEDQIAAGSAATPEQLQAVIDSLRAVQTDVSSTPTS